MNRDDNNTRMTLGEHLEELRRRLIYALAALVVGVALATALGNRLLKLLLYSYERVMTQAGLDPSLAVPNVTAGIGMYMNIALVAGLLIASPWVIYQLWMFIATGLYEKEKRIVRRTVPFSAALFLAGAAFFLFVASMPLLRFLVRFNRWLGVRHVIMLGEYIGFITRMTMIFGLAFQTPLAVVVLSWVGLVNLRQLNHYRRHVIIAVLVFAAVVTFSPVDQMVLAIPMWLLYELGLLLSYLAVFRPRRREIAD
jgi:sec-independent protein translocase protein TatC